MNAAYDECLIFYVYPTWVNDLNMIHDTTCRKVAILRDNRERSPNFQHQEKEQSSLNCPFWAFSDQTSCERHKIFCRLIRNDESNSRWSGVVTSDDRRGVNRSACRW